MPGSNVSRVPPFRARSKIQMSPPPFLGVRWLITTFCSSGESRGVPKKSAGPAMSNSSLPARSTHTRRDVDSPVW